MNKVGILGIGSEITMGYIVDTNSNFLSNELRTIGLDVNYIINTPDIKHNVISALEFLSKNVDIIITTGGLGPTQDDLTRECISEFTNTEFVKSEKVLGDIKEKFRKMKITMPESNVKQAYVPKNGIAISNPIGSASGFVIVKDDKIYISLPGVPQEMKEMYRSFLRDYLKSKNFGNNVQQLFAKVLGVPESTLDELIPKLVLPEGVTYGTIADYGIVDVVFNISQNDYYYYSNLIKQKLNDALERLKNENFDPLVLYSESRENIFQILSNIFIFNDLTLAIAESASGGALSNLVTDIPGSSKYFVGCVVSYTTLSKSKILMISEEILSKYTSTSMKTTGEMAINIRNILKSDYSLAITGIAGPTLDDSGKDIGTFFVSVSSHKRDIPIVREYKLFGNREKLKTHVSMKAVGLLLKVVNEDGYKYNF